MAAYQIFSLFLALLRPYDRSILWPFICNCYLWKWIQFSAFFASKGSTTKHFEITTASIPPTHKHTMIVEGKNEFKVEEILESRRKEYRIWFTGKATQFMGKYKVCACSKINIIVLPAPPRQIKSFHAPRILQSQNLRRNKLMNGLAIQRATIYGETSWLARLCLQHPGLHSTREWGKDLSNWLDMFQEESPDWEDSYNQDSLDLDSFSDTLSLPPLPSSHHKGNSWALFGSWKKRGVLFREGLMCGPLKEE